MHLSQGETHSPTALVTGSRGCGVGMEGQRYPLGGGGRGGRVDGGRGEARGRSWEEKRNEEQQDEGEKTGEELEE